MSKQNVQSEQWICHYFRLSLWITSIPFSKHKNEFILLFSIKMDGIRTICQTHQWQEFNSHFKIRVRAQENVYLSNKMWNTNKVHD